MLQLLDDSFSTYLRAIVPLPTREVDIVFAAPDRDWGARVSRPTINLYLWDVRPSIAERELGIETIPVDGGRPRRQGPMPRIDCRYLVTAWTNEVGDEHSLLGRVLTALLVNPVIDPTHLKGVLAEVRPLPTVTLRTGQGGDNADFWSALGGQLKPGLDVVITMTVDAVTFTEAGPPVETITLDERTVDHAELASVVVNDGAGPLG